MCLGLRLLCALSGGCWQEHTHLTLLCTFRASFPVQTAKTLRCFRVRFSSAALNAELSTPH